ncbi:MAG: CHASE3 domain-containing protein [Planctomycetota bacterium]
MTLRAQLLLGSCLVFALMVANAVAAHRALGSLGESARWVSHTHEVISRVHLVEKLLIDMETGKRGFLITGIEEFLEPYDEGLVQYRSTMRGLQRLVSDNSGQVDRLKNIDMFVNRWLDRAAKPEIAARRVANDKATSDTVRAMIASKTGKNMMDNLRAKLASVVHEEKSLLSLREVEAERTRRTATGLIVVGTLLAVVIGALSLYLVSSGIIRRVGGEPAEIAAFTERIARGELEATESVPSGATGILDSVRSMSDSLKENAARARERSWLKIGLHELSDCMRGQTRMQSLGNDIASFLCRYVNAQIAAVYVDRREESGEDGVLTLTGSYAFSSTQRKVERVSVSEGLIGEAIRSHEVLTVRELPESYLTIQSALGSTCPKNLIVVPLFFEGEVVGLVEIGTTGSFSDLDKQFLERAGESIAVSLRSLQSREELEEREAELWRSNLELEEARRGLEERVEERTTEMRIAKEKAETAAQSRTRFLANMSHEIRTPISGVLGMTELLLDCNLDEESSQYAQNAQQSAAGLMTILNDILDFAKVDANELALETIPFDLRKLVEQVCWTLEPVAAGKSIQLTSEVSPGCPGLVAGDPTRLRQILYNLVGNGIKFTNQGHVAVRVSIVDSDERSARLEIAVEDTGIGISPAKQATIFESFSQADDSTTRRFGGTGLGLAISKRLVSLMGGELSVTSTPAEGSKFWFTAAFGTVDETSVTLLSDEVDPRHPRWDSTPRVLLVEDTKIQVLIAKKMLESLECDVAVASNGAEAVRAVSDQDFDLVLMDCHMPVMGGEEATRRIRELEGDRARVPIVALTAGALASDRDKCIEAGMDDFLTKPCSRKNLELALSRMLRHRQGVENRELQETS